MQVKHALIHHLGSGSALENFNKYKRDTELADKKNSEQILHSWSINYSYKGGKCAGTQLFPTAHYIYLVEWIHHT